MKIVFKISIVGCNRYYCGTGENNKPLFLHTVPKIKNYPQVVEFATYREAELRVFSLHVNTGTCYQIEKHYVEEEVKTGIIGTDDIETVTNTITIGCLDFKLSHSGVEVFDNETAERIALITQERRVNYNFYPGKEEAAKIFDFANKEDPKLDDKFVFYNRPNKTP